MKAHRVLFASAVVAASLFPAAARAQIITTIGANVYTQNFDSLITSGTAVFANGNDPTPTLAGWWAAGEQPGATPDYNADSGTQNSNDIFSYGTGPGNTERALGILGSTSQGVALRLLNNTGTIITSVTISYNGEQWRRGATTGTGNVDRLDFAYRGPNATSSYADSSILAAATAGEWINWDALDFSTTVNGGTDEAGASLSPNPVTTAISGTITGLSWSDGQYLWLRWRDNSRSDLEQNGMAIDDLSISAIPEPSIYAALLGLATLGIVVVRRRKALQAV